MLTSPSRMNAKSFILGILAALLILVGGERAYHTYSWAGQVNNEAKAAYSYLAQPVATDKSGKPVSRAQILDAFIEQAKRASQQQAQYRGNGAPNGKN
jgi:hypothetical protein